MTMAKVKVRRDELDRVMEAAARIARRTNSTFRLLTERIEIEEAAPSSLNQSESSTA